MWGGRRWSHWFPCQLGRTISDTGLANHTHLFDISCNMWPEYTLLCSPTFSVLQPDDLLHKKDAVAKWTFLDSFWWGLMVLTTVGNGAKAPHTFDGQVVSKRFHKRHENYTYCSLICSEGLVHIRANSVTDIM